MRLQLWIGAIVASGLVAACNETPEEPAFDPYTFATPTPQVYLADSFGLDSLAYADRLTGALIGSAVGDAMGAGTEMWPRSEIELRHGYITGITASLRPRSPEGPWLHNGAPGSTTDDTRWKQLILDYIDEAGEEASAERFAEFISNYYYGQLDLLAEESQERDVDRLDARIEQLDWIKEWARVAIAFRQSPKAYQLAHSRFYGGEMSCAGLLYTPVFGLIAPSPDSAYRLAYDHAIFDHGYAKDIAGLAAAMTHTALRTADLDSVLSVAYFVDPHGFSDGRLVGRIAAAIAQDTRRAVRHARTAPVLDTLVSPLGEPLRIPARYPHAREEWVRQQRVYTYLDRHERAIAFHAAEIWQIVIAGLAWGNGDFEETLQFIVNYGRDNDTAAAVAGTILGAQLGAGKLPASLTEPVIVETQRGAGIKLVQ